MADSGLKVGFDDVDRGYEARAAIFGQMVSEALFFMMKSAAFCRRN